MIQRLIVNADDFGMTQGINAGIILAHSQGIITSTTCMMNMPYAKQALTLAKRYPHLGVGIHLVLTVGSPLTKNAKSFTDEKGHFIKIKDYPNKKPQPQKDELYQEWKAQIEQFIKLSGHKPTHLDSHHHVHLLPGLIDVAVRLAIEYDMPMRQINHCLHTYEYVQCEKDFYNQQVSIDYFKQSVLNHQGDLEIMCHPAMIDQRLYDMSSYSLLRMKELEILTSQDIKDFLHQHHIQLIHYQHIQKVA